MKSISPKELLRDAEALANGFTSEARRRSAVSRAYYAAYHRCLAWIRLLPNCPEPPKAGSVHGWLIDRLGDPDPECDVRIAERSRALGRLMLAQRGRRVRADYELENPVNQTMLSKQIESARQTFETCAGPES